MFVIFTIGYLLGGVTATILLALTIAARNGEQVSRASAWLDPEDTAAARRERS